ncbi:RICIN domain-containing protein [Streptomyces sp. NPDC001914]|uniref:RICIN domain-containing protein n=1 Tax=Streptomyces sp. NPDC001914 TaxID=3364623 RepID=UPI00367CE67F
MPCASAVDRLWTLIDNGDGWLNIVNVRSGKLLAVDGIRSADATEVTQWEDNGTAHHLWRFL